MTEEAKKPARKTAAKAPAAKAPAKRKRAPKKGPKIIRNLRGTTVHVRLEHATREKPFRVELKPRGVAGDCKVIPVEAQGSDFILNVDLLYEVITEAEYMRAQEEYPQVGYTPRQAPVLIREEDNRIAHFRDWDGKGRAPVDRSVPAQTSNENVGPHYPNIPGADHGLHNQLNGRQEGAMPPGVSFERPESITLERKRV